MLKPPREELVGLWAESLLTATSVAWWTYLVWAHRNALYADPDPVALILTVVLSLPVTWTLWLRAVRLRGANLALVAVRGIAVLTLSLWLFQDL
ncbi:hypothetical protein [Streptomyces sp. NRRL F-525]|uniref:hypothetical protein n=1 Tax=Streptomyces sp. NRRL F-525 TaxID=1463861 RepID=UPI0005248889|nr:hypothetical protein [Streptomyces sp. NRRL F-525]